LRHWVAQVELAEQEAALAPPELMELTAMTERF
jgi:hypothetical protein